MPLESVLTLLRDQLHAALLNTGILTMDAAGVVSIADKSQRLSKEVATHIYRTLRERADAHESTTSVERANSKVPGQTSGNAFESEIATYIANALPHLKHLLAGTFTVEHVKGRGGTAQIHRFRQYAHLKQLEERIRDDVELRAALGNAYDIAPDIVVARELLTVNDMNDGYRNEGGSHLEKLLGEAIAELASIKKTATNDLPILHAVISCKWTMRSDRAQNARSEALNLIRNRKGHLPHIMVVTAEPSPSRLASLALGTGDIDCLYHLALPELVEAIEHYGDSNALATLRTMIDGQRLKDISDLPLDLIV